MALRPVQSDEFEALLADAFEAERAGVFRSTPLDVEKLMRSAGGRRMNRLHRFAVAGLPVAAAVAFFLAVAAFWDGPRSSQVITDGNTAAGAQQQCETLENLRACFTGPGVLARSDCLCVDLDKDGDVDLRDLGMFQLEDTP